MNHSKEPRVDGSGSLIAQSENENPGRLVAADRQDVSEIEIEREDDSAFGQSLCHDVWIGKADQSFVAKMHSVMTRPRVTLPPLRAIRPCRPGISSRRAFEEPDFLVGERRSILERLPHVFAFEFGILADDVFR